MPWDVKYAPETDTLELKHAGRLSSEDTRQQARLLFFLMHGTQTTRFLLDYSDTVPTVPDEDVRTLQDYCERLGTLLYLKVALVLPRSLADIFPFPLLARLARERGVRLELFPTPALGRAWLRPGREFGRAAA